MSTTTKYINAAGYECECIPFTATLPKTPADVARFVAASVRDVYLSIANPYKLVYHLDEPAKPAASRRRWWSVTARAGAAGEPDAAEAAVEAETTAPAARATTVPPIRVVTSDEVIAIPAGLASIRVTPPLTARDRVASAKRKVARRAADWAARRAVERRARTEAAAAKRLAKQQAKQAKKKEAKKCVAPPKPVTAAAPPRAGWRLRSGARVAPAPSAPETPATPSPAVTPHAHTAALLAANARLGAQVAALQAEKAALALRVETLTAQLARARSDAGADAAAAVRRIDALLYRRVPRTEGAPAAAVAAAARAAAALRADVEARAAKATGKE